MYGIVHGGKVCYGMVYAMMNDVVCDRRLGGSVDKRCGVGVWNSE